MFDSILGFATENTSLLMGGGTAGIILWVLKKVPNDQIANIVGTFAETIGRVCTLNLSLFSMTAKYWNSVVEPWLVDLIENTAGACVKGLIAGLRSDNKK